MNVSLGVLRWGMRGAPVFERSTYMVHPVLFSSASQKWETPPPLVAQLNHVFPWDLDVAASRSNVCENFLTIADNALDEDTPWGRLNYMNPPYGRSRTTPRATTGDWVRRAHLADLKGKTTVCLVAARTDLWWHEWVTKSQLVVFLRGRLRFGSDEYWQARWDDPGDILYGRHGFRAQAPFPSAFVVYDRTRRLTTEQLQFLASYGWAVPPSVMALATLGRGRTFPFTS